jgi:CRP/FNR family transcriptional regulator, cyclic AMP receptor protein
MDARPRPETAARPRQSVAIRRTLEQSEHFRHVAARDLDRLAQLARPRRLHNDERVHSAGSYDGHLWIVLSGAVRISTSTAKGAEHVYAVLGPGNYFGLAAVIGKGVGIIEARAFGATQLAWIEGAALMRLLDDRPPLWRHFGALLSHRLMVALMLLRDNTACALPERLVRRLLVLLPAIEPASGELVLPMTQSDLARMLGTSRSRVNSELRRLESEGLVRSGYRGITLLDLPRLRALSARDMQAF